jgi:O-antigen ligase
VSNEWRYIRNTASTYSLCGAVIAMPFSIVLCHTCLILYLALWLLENNWREKFDHIKSNRQLQVLLALGITLSAGIIYSENRDLAWLAMERKAFFFLIPFAIATSDSKPSKLFATLSKLFCLSCFVALIICYLHALTQMNLYEHGEIGKETISYLSSSEFGNTNTAKGWLFFSYISLSGGISMHPTYLALYCAFCCVVLVPEHFRASGIFYKGGTLALLVFFSVSIIFLAARIIIVLLIVGYLITLTNELLIAKSKIKNTILPAFLALVLIAGVVLNPVTKYRQISEIVSTKVSVSPGTEYTNSIGIRASLWWLSYKAYLNSNPIIGTGIGDVQQSVKKMSEVYLDTNVLESYDPHSQYLYVLLSSGILGLVLFLSYLGIGFANAWQTRDIIFLNFLFLFSVVCITESVLELQKGIVFFTIFFSTMAFTNSKAKLKSPSTEFSHATH